MFGAMFIGAQLGGGQFLSPPTTMAPKSPTRDLVVHPQISCGWGRRRFNFIFCLLRPSLDSWQALPQTEGAPTPAGYHPGGGGQKIIHSKATCRFDVEKQAMETSNICKFAYFTRLSNLLQQKVLFQAAKWRSMDGKLIPGHPQGPHGYPQGTTRYPRATEGNSYSEPPWSLD